MVEDRRFWEQRVCAEDLGLLTGKLQELQISGSAALLHRMSDTRELPVCVSHRMKKVRIDGVEMILGSLTPIDADSKVSGPDSNTISRFVHKIGNHFQLIALLANSLAKTLPESRDSHLLQEALERAIELVRTFSEYSLPPACLPHIDLCEVVRAAVITRRDLFQEKGVDLEEKFAESLDDATLPGDPFLLESAVGHILQNALEATQVGGVVAIVGYVDSYGDQPPVARVRVTDRGCGIDPNDLAKVTAPFFTSKKDHDGLGLTLSCRFVELHGGSLKIRSTVGRGSEVEISLPVASSKKDAL